MYQFHNNFSFNVQNQFVRKSSSILLVLTIFMIENAYFVVATETKKVNISTTTL